MDVDMQKLFELKDCRTCKHGGMDEQMGMPMCHSGDSDASNCYEVETDLSRIYAVLEWFQNRKQNPS